MSDKKSLSVLDAFDVFETAEIIKKGTANVELIESISKPDILELADFLMKAFESRNSPAQPQFSHSASLSLSGRGKCEDFEHRLRDLLSCAQFSVLYSDRVYVHNFFSDYQEDLRHRKTPELRRLLIEDINLLLLIKPLLISGYIEFFVPEIHSCTNCLQKALPDNVMSRIQKARRKLSKEFLDNLTITLTEYSRSKYEILLDGPASYLEHPTFRIGNKCQPLITLIESNRELIRTLRTNGSVELPKSFLKTYGSHEELAAGIADSVATSILTSQMRHASFLTDSDLDIAFLTSVVNDEEIEQRNAIAYKCLTSSLPFVNDVSLSQLIDLRSREEDAFIVYRSALNEAIKEFVTDKQGLSEKQANQLYADVIEPKLARLNQKVKATKKEMFSKGLRSAVAVTGVLTFGLYTGILSPEIVAAAATLSVGEVGIDLLKEVLPIGKSDLVAGTDDLYFLWKVKKIAS